eukprot:symbB.v1.2.025826.t1/scaffold2533.1/size76754/7
MSNAVLAEQVATLTEHMKLLATQQEALIRSHQTMLKSAGSAEGAAVLPPGGPAKRPGMPSLSAALPVPKAGHVGFYGPVGESPAEGRIVRALWLMFASWEVVCISFAAGAEKPHSFCSFCEYDRPAVSEDDRVRGPSIPTLFPLPDFGRMPVGVFEISQTGRKPKIRDTEDTIAALALKWDEKGLLVVHMTGQLTRSPS